MICGSVQKAQRVICLTGPTGTGKSALALALVQNFNGAIINIDSRQVYSGLPIITAQPTAKELKKSPHLLYGFLPCSQKITVGLFVELALEAIHLCFCKGFQPILVGGTGLYLDALIKGIAPIPKVGKEVSSYWQMRLERAGSRILYKELAGVDPNYAAKISNNDPQRITRALAVWVGTGRTLTWWHKQPMAPFPYDVLKLGIKLPIDALKGQLELRIDKMLEAGALAEVENMLGGWHDLKLPGFSSIGFPELVEFSSGKANLDKCKEKWLASTRAYAKRQLTWFKKDKDICWLDEKDTSGQAIELTQAFLRKC